MSEEEEEEEEKNYYYGMEESEGTLPQTVLASLLLNGF